MRPIEVRIARPFAEVETYLRDRSRWPEWAAGLASGIEPAGDDWIVRQAGGTATLRFPSDRQGVHDHVVALPDGSEVHVPMRAEAIGDATRVVLTLMRQPDMTDEAFARDAGAMRRDLDALRDILEAA